MNATLKLKIKDVEIELSLEDAKELRSLLEDLVGPKDPIVIEKWIEKYRDRYPYWPRYPYWTTDTYQTAGEVPMVSWTSESGTVTASLEASN